MALFFRNTKTKSNSMRTAVPKVEIFNADAAPALQVEWETTEGNNIRKNYSLILYGYEIPAFIDAIQNPGKRMPDYLATPELAARSCIKHLLHFGLRDVAVRNNSDGKNYRLKLEEIDPLI